MRIHLGVSVLCTLGTSSSAHVEGTEASNARTTTYPLPESTGPSGLKPPQARRDAQPATFGPGGVAHETPSGSRTPAPEAPIDPALLQGGRSRVLRLRAFGRNDAN